MRDSYLSKVGNIGDYVNVPRGSRPIGPIADGSASPELILKLYDMHVIGTETPPELIEQSKNFLYRLMLGKKIDPRLGLGFAILSMEKSEGVLNIARWDKKYPHLLISDVYFFEGDLHKVEKMDINQAGAFCMWEMAIAFYEARVWSRYINSNRTDINKESYLKSMVEGPLTPVLNADNPNPFNVFIHD